MDKREYIKYFPELEKHVIEHDENLYFLLLFNAFSMMRDNLTLFLQLNHFHLPYIDCQIEFKDSIINCPKYELYLKIFYMDMWDARTYLFYLDLFPYQNEILYSNKSDKIEKIFIRSHYDRTRGEPTILFTRSNLYFPPNYEISQIIDLDKTNNFIFEMNSVNRLEDFDHKPCIQTNIGIFNNDSMDECLMDCVNNIYNQTYGCIPIMNIDNIWIRLERDLEYFRYILCKDLNITLESKEFYELCMNKCPSSCNIPFFKVNHYTQENHDDYDYDDDDDDGYVTKLNIIPKYTNDISYIESYRMSFYDLFYEIGGLIGLWLGLSVISLANIPIVLSRYLSKIYRLSINFFRNTLLKIRKIFSFCLQQIITFNIIVKHLFNRRKSKILPIKLEHNLFINVINNLPDRIENNSPLLLPFKSRNQKPNILPKVRHQIASTYRSSVKIRHNLKPRIQKPIPASDHKIIKSVRTIKVVPKDEQGV